MPKKNKLTAARIRSSHLHGYWKRLKKHGFKLGKEWMVLYTIKGSPYTYIRTFWTFNRGDEKALLCLSVHGYRLKFTKAKSVALEVTKRCWSHLEKPFLKYFGDKTPLEINRLGKQTEAVGIWLNGKYAKAQEAARLARKRDKAKAAKMKARGK
jgi:hypothetical protein